MKILYFYDPLCGWCFAFADAVKQLKEKYPDWDFEIISGGMVRGVNEGPIGNMSSYILSALPRVEEMSGVKFGTAYREVLKDGTQNTSSVPPSKALAIVKKHFPEQQYSYAEAMQQAYYIEGQDLTSIETHKKLFADLGFPVELLENEFDSEEAMKLALEDFQFSANCGITGYPALVIQKGEEYFLAAKGYTSFEQLANVVDRIIE